MAVDLKVISVHLWRLSVFLAGTCFRFAQKHPCISGTLSVLFILYVFFPLVFRVLIYASPIMFCAYAYRKNAVKRELHMQPLGSEFNKVSDDDVHVHGFKKLRKDLKESESDLLGKADNDFKKSKELEETDNASKQNGESESDILTRDEYEDDEETQEEDAQEDTQKAVEWTEQDEKNLMELGTSETERDKRLESLIQKRRARKVLSMQVRNVMDIMRQTPNQIAPLVIARSTGPLNLINTLSETDDLHMPGSAPSVLLPSRSPFDLPYDPFEERPDLTGDRSFEQEFIPADQKDFCRHESFFVGGHSGTRQDGNSLNSFMNAEKKRNERFSRFRSYIDRGSYETISTEASFLEHELMNSGEATIPESGCELQSSMQPEKSDSVISNVSIKSESGDTGREEKCDSEPVDAIANTAGRLETEGNIEPGLLNYGKNMSDSQVEGAKEENLSSYLHKSLAFSIQENVAKEARGNGSVKDLFNVHKRAFHTPAHSIASDLVVEVSEAGSPPPTLSPPDEDSSHYDGDVERDLSSGSEDISMHVYRTDEHATRSIEEQEIIPEVIVLEEEVVDEYEHTSPTSSDDNSSFENVVHHLNEKLNARRLSDKVIMGTPEESSKPTEISSGVQIENMLSHQTDPSNQEKSTEKLGSPVEEQGSSNMQVTEHVGENTAIQTSDGTTLVAEQEAQAVEEASEVTSPISVLRLPDADFIDQITGTEGNHVAMHADNTVEAVHSVGETSNMELIEDEKGTVSINNPYEYSLRQSSAEALPLSNTLNSDDEFNGMFEKSKGSSTAEASEQNVYTDLKTLGDTITATSASDIDTPGGNQDVTSVKSEPSSNQDSKNQVALSDMDTELQIHRITETCM